MALTKRARDADVRVTGTRERVLDAAIALFADRGFDAVSVREIALAAGANIASIGYYFGSKENLVCEAFASIVRPINAERLRFLDLALGASPPSEAPTLDDILRAFIAPVVQQRGRAPSSYHRFHILAYALRRPFIDEIVKRENDTVARRFWRALCLALPELPEEDVWWRYDFAVGALIHVMLDADRGHRLRRLSQNWCDTDDGERLAAQLLAFVRTGFSAPSPKADATSSAKSRRRARQ